MSGAPRGVIRVCCYGLGGLGSSTARALLDAPGIEIVGAIDADRARAGRDLRTCLRLKGRSGVTVSGDARAALAACSPDVVVLCTGSRMQEVAPQIEEIVAAGAHCVTSAEEMALPQESEPAIARGLDSLARARGVAVIGAGVNPGFAMDALALALSGASCGITHVAVERVVDPLTQRRSYRKLVGLGTTWQRAARLVADGRIGHVGLRQSALLVARGLGWAIDRIEEEVRVLTGSGPVAARRTRRPRPDAAVRGLQQTLSARQSGKELIRMEMIMAAGIEAPHDAITISGQPDLRLWIPGGIPADPAGVACLVNAVPKAMAAPRPGLLTILDLPLRASREAAAPLPTS